MGPVNFANLNMKPPFATPPIEQVRREHDEYCRELARRSVGEARIKAPDLPLLVERIRHLVLSDRVAFYWNVTASWEDGRPILRGETERPEFQRVLRAVLRWLGFAGVVDRVRLVPDLRNGPFPGAVVTIPHLLTNSRPDFTGIGMDEALYGEPVYLLKEYPQALLTKSIAGYWGFAPKAGIRRVSPEEFKRRLNAPKALVVEDCATAGASIPAGARLPLRRWGKGSRCVVMGALGERLVLPKKCCRRVDGQAQLNQMLGFAKSFLESPYHLGGKNSQTGIDCSGLVQMSFQSIGVNLPRDANQQYLAGHLIHPCAADALLPGDALFFIGATGQVDHTALYLGRDKMLHAASSRGRVSVQSLNPGQPEYFERYPDEFIGARRLWW